MYVCMCAGVCIEHAICRSFLSLCACNTKWKSICVCLCEWVVDGAQVTPFHCGDATAWQRIDWHFKVPLYTHCMLQICAVLFVCVCVHELSNLCENSKWRQALRRCGATEQLFRPYASFDKLLMTTTKKRHTTTHAKKKIATAFSYTKRSVRNIFMHERTHTSSASHILNK